MPGEREYHVCRQARIMVWRLHRPGYALPEIDQEVASKLQNEAGALLQKEAESSVCSSAVTPATRARSICTTFVRAVQCSQANRGGRLRDVYVLFFVTRAVVDDCYCS